MAEKLVSNTVVTNLLSTVDSATGSRMCTAAVIQNLGPNAIWIEINATPEETKSFKLAAGASLALQGEQLKKCQVKALASTAPQSTGAATIVLEIH